MAFENLKLSISNLWDEFGQTDNAVVGLIVNLSLAVLGVIAFALTSNQWLELVAIAWTLLNVWGILSWVIFQ